MASILAEGTASAEYSEKFARRSSCAFSQGLIRELVRELVCRLIRELARKLIRELARKLIRELARELARTPHRRPMRLRYGWREEPTGTFSRH